MTLTKKQRKLRKQHLGASDIAALFGLDPFKTGTDVWLSKAFETDEPEVYNKSIQRGNDYEAPLLRDAAEELGVRISTRPDVLFRVSSKHPIFSATLDAKIIGANEAIEAKTTRISDEWGEPGTDQIPERVLVQVQAQMLCHKLDRVHVIAMTPKSFPEGHLYRVERNEDIIKAIIKKGESFWNKYVLTKRQPPEELFGLGDLDVIKRVVRVPETWAVVPDELIEDWENKKQARIDAEKAEKEALSRILTPLGDAEGVQMRDGRMLTYFSQERSSIDTKLLKAEKPDIFDLYQKKSTYRVPRIKKGE